MLSRQIFSKLHAENLSTKADIFSGPRTSSLSLWLKFQAHYPQDFSTTLSVQSPRGMHPVPLGLTARPYASNLPLLFASAFQWAPHSPIVSLDLHAL